MAFWVSAPAVPVLFLEGADRSDRIRIVGACRRLLIVAQFFQPLLQRRDLGALVALLHGNAFHGAQGPHVGLLAARALRVSGIQESLEVRIHDPRHRIFVLFLESLHGLLRSAAELAVRLALQVAQFDQGFLQRGHVSSGIAFLKDLVSAGILFRAQRRYRGWRRRHRDLFDFFQYDVLRLHIAGFLAVVDRSPAALLAHAVDRDLSPGRYMGQQLAADGAGSAQIHLHLRLRGVGIAAHNLQRCRRLRFALVPGCSGCRRNHAESKHNHHRQHRQNVKTLLQLEHFKTSRTQDQDILVPPTFVHTMILSPVSQNVNKNFIFL